MHSHQHEAELENILQKHGAKPPAEQTNLEHALHNTCNGFLKSDEKTAQTSRRSKSQQTLCFGGSATTEGL